MQIFLSYAAEDRVLAEAIQLALAGAGHEVFYDRESLAAGAEYHSRIRRAIEASDLFVFLVSPESVATGGYCRTELKFARDKWAHPSRGVLPVLARATDFASIPAYLKEVTIEQPEGHAAAEVLALVEQRAPAAAPAVHAPAPPAAVTAVFGAISYVHDRMVGSPQGMVPGMVLSVPLTVQAAPGAVVQLGVRFAVWGGAPLMANPMETMFRDPSGAVAIWNQPRALQQATESFVEQQMAVAYYVLNLMPTQFSVVHSLVFTVEAFVNRQAVARSAPVPFQLRW